MCTHVHPVDAFFPLWPDPASDPACIARCHLHRKAPHDSSPSPLRGPAGGTGGVFCRRDPRVQDLDGDSAGVSDVAQDDTDSCSRRREGLGRGSAESGGAGPLQRIPQDPRRHPTEWRPFATQVVDLSTICVPPFILLLADSLPQWLQLELTHIPTAALNTVSLLCCTI